MKTKKRPKPPEPPEQIEGEALLEWDRVCEELEAHELPTDRPMILLWVQTWAVNHDVSRHVNKFGSIAPAANKVIGKSPWYTVQRETANALSKLADQMGLSAAARDFDKKKESEEATSDRIEF